MFLTFISAYENGKKTEYRLRKIVDNYLTGFFIIDCIANLPFVSTLGTSRTAYYFRFIRIIKISRIFTNSERILELISTKWTKKNQKRSIFIFILVKFLIYIFSILHIQACILVYIGLTNSVEEKGWIEWMHPHRRDPGIWDTLYI